MAGTVKTSRRAFMKTVGLAGAAALAATVAGCAPTGNEKGLAASGAALEGADDSWDEEFDVIVVGAGAAGTAAAVEVSRLDENASCLLLEKEKMPSGCTPYSGGIMVWGTDSTEILTYLKALTKGHTPDDVLTAFAEGLVDLRPWLHSFDLADDAFGMDIPPEVFPGAEHPELPGNQSLGLIRVGNGFGSGTGSNGSYGHVHELLLDIIANTSSVEYRTGCPAEDLVQSPNDGTILGVVADGKRIKATKGVIMACGGFEHNEKMKAAFLGTPYAASYSGMGNTGDGIAMVQKVGAALWHMNACAGFWMGGRDLENTAFTTTNFDADTRPKQFGITVGVNGRRFYMDYDSVMGNCGNGEQNGYERNSDHTIHVGSRHGYMQFGGEWTHLPMPEKAWFVFDADGLAAGAIEQTLSTDPVADGYVVAADSIDELAQLIEVPSDELSQTIETWNGFCSEGIDRAFYRPERTLNPVKNGPFYAQLCIPAMLNTDGGPCRNAKAEVLDAEGNAIPHLYAAGEFGSVWSGTYQGGGNIAECMVFGRIAAKSALESA
ncbi:FAD-dependent oxidoreductase [Adlercreutzia caecimuris]|uniref:FAD-dependent oxidoreductase n=1 Tax=Adlercreutzia caecimuris TaxID=671266 RepID=UPI002729F9D9|nr:FAD-dependent oxidoreductase [Adlercreutzia caecimuris]